MPVDPLCLCLACSFACNSFCGIGHQGGGTYTAVGIAKLCEGLKGSSITTLECAAATPAPMRSSAHHFPHVNTIWNCAA